MFYGIRIGSLGIPGYGGTSGPSNAAPVIDLNGASGGINASGTFTEGDSYTSYLSSATLTDPDGDPLVSLTMTCGGQWGDDGPDELIKFDTWVTDSDTDKTENLVVGSTTFQLAFVAATGVLTITKSGGGTFPAADGQALQRLFQYVNPAEPPTAGDRTFTWVANDGTDNSTAAVLTVTVQEAAGIPVVDLDSTTAGNDAAVLWVDEPVDVTPNATIDSGGAPLTQMTFVFGDILDGADEVIYLGYVPFSLNANKAAVGYNGSIEFLLSYTTGTQTLIATRYGGGTFSASEGEALQATLRYHNTVGA